MNSAADIKQAFQRVYDENRWSIGSGPGSSPRNTVEYRAFLERFIENNNVKTIVDLGCGDWQFSPLIDWSEREYKGYDVVPGIVEANRAEFQSKNVKFEVFRDINELPSSDLCIAKEVFQHLPNDVISSYINVIRQKFRFALITNNIEPHAHCNIDTPAGGCRPVRLDESPFLTLGATVFSYYTFANGTYWKNGVFLVVGNSNRD
ncbi:MAG: class I SAM-dependent methyltransferase [Alphaproteobacteria bacterium]|nr:class I SAM-dependent methyltransferase [Alphaproteobacteria bacterium]